MNGGGAVTFQFQRSKLNAASRTVFVPWNEIFTLNPVVMAATGGNADALPDDWTDQESQVCNYDRDNKFIIHILRRKKSRSRGEFRPAQSSVVNSFTTSVAFSTFARPVKATKVVRRQNESEADFG